MRRASELMLAAYIKNNEYYGDQIKEVLVLIEQEIENNSDQERFYVSLNSGLNYEVEKLIKRYLNDLGYKVDFNGASATITWGLNQSIHETVESIEDVLKGIKNSIDIY